MNPFTRRPARPEPERDVALAAYAGAGNLIASTTGVWAWYVLGDQPYFYRRTDERERLRADVMARWAELVGYRVHLRITQHPYPWAAWAKHFYAKHPAATRAADPRAGETFVGWVGAMQRRIGPPREWPTPADDTERAAQDAQRAQLVDGIGAWTPATYLGVRLSLARHTRDDLDAVLNGTAATSSQRRLRDLAVAHDNVARTMTGPGFGAKALTGRALAWLINASLTPGLPVEAEQLDVAASGWDRDTVEEFTAAVKSGARPYAQTAQVLAPRGNELRRIYTSVVSLARVPERDIVDARHPTLAWLHTIDQRVQVSAVLDVLDGRVIAGKATKVREHVDIQIEHLEENKKKPPLRLLRLKAAAARVEDERTSPIDAVRVRLSGQVRFMVTGRTERETTEARDRFTKLFSAAQAGTVLKHHDQWACYREFVPGEPSSNQGFVRPIPAPLAAAWVPNASTAIGDRSGPYRGHTTRVGRTPFHWDPQAATRAGRSGLIAVLAGLGAGKSYLGGGTVESEVRLGHQVGVLDPAGKVRKLLRLEHLAGQVRDLDLENAPSGLFIPWAQVPDPRRADFADDDEYDRAVVGAEQERMQRAVETYLGRLPYSYVHSVRGVHYALEAAVTSVGGAHDTDPWAFLDALTAEGDVGAEVSRMLQASAHLSGGRLVIPPRTGWRPAATDYLGDSVIISARNMRLPSPGTPEENYSPAERYAAQLMKDAAGYLAGMMYAGEHPKFINLEEAGDVGGFGSFVGLATRGALHTRKSNTALMLVVQEVLQARKAIPNLHAFLGDAFIGRMNDAAAPAACELVGIPPEYAPVIGSLGVGEWLVNHHAGGRQTVQIDTEYRPGVHELLRTNPPGHAPGIDVLDVDRHLQHGQEVYA